MSPKKRTNAVKRKFKGFTDEERAAMKDRVQELKADKGRGKRRAREDRHDGGTGSRHGKAAPCDH